MDDERSPIDRPEGQDQETQGGGRSAPSVRDALVYIQRGLKYSSESARSKDPGHAVACASEAMNQLSSAVDILRGVCDLSDDTRLMLVEAMVIRAEAAYWKGDWVATGESALEALALAGSLPEDDIGNVVFGAHHLLGMVAFENGEIAEARFRLLESAKTKGSPQLGSFGPSMKLASSLLNAGESEAVLEFIERCRAFWECGEEWLTEWERVIKEGQTPDFGPNMMY